MAKKPTKRSKAKPSRVIKTYQLGLFGGKTLIARRPVPTPAEQARSREFQRESDEYLASTEFRDAMARESAAKAAHQERLSRRPATMRASSYRLPPDVQSFLLKLHDNPLRFASIDGIVTVASDEAAALIEAAYLRGCTEGYIEGKVADREPRVARSQKANDAKRRKPVRVGTATMTRAERAACMAAEYDELAKLMKHTHACQRLADKYDFESWQGVAAAIKQFRKRSRQ